jgi:hypothetical protein
VLEVGDHGEVDLAPELDADDPVRLGLQRNSE